MTRARMVTATVALALASAVVTTGAVIAQEAGRTAAQPRMRHPGPGGPFGLAPLFDGRMGLLLPIRELNLTEAQHEQVRSILQSHGDELRAAAEQLRAATRAQHDAVTAVPYDEGTIRERSTALAAVQSDAAVLHAKVHSDVWAVLTPEQQAKANEIKAAREQRISDVRQRVRERVQPRQ